MTGRSPTWLALVAAIVLSIGLSDPGLAQRRNTRASSPPTSDFALRLHTFAAAKVGAGQPGYYAIVRRGFEKLDKLTPRFGIARAARSIDFTALDATPEAIDSDPSGQTLISVRLGIWPDNRERIVHGWPLQKGSFDTTVMLVGNGFLCSGIALDKRTVLTAAHCACDLHLAQSDGNNLDRGKQVLEGLGNDANSKRHPVVLGSTRFISVDVFGAPACPDVLPGIRAGRPDLALIKLGEDFEMDVPATKIATDAMLNTWIGVKFFYVVGFGCTVALQSAGRFYQCDSGSIGQKFAGVINGSAQCSNTSSADECAPGLKEFKLRDNQTMTDTCAGDSGGPVVVLDGSTFFLVGITSRALSTGGVCGLPVQVTGWLQSILGSNNQ
jgi:hypothetical protein